MKTEDVWFVVLIGFFFLTIMHIANMIYFRTKQRTFTATYKVGSREYKNLMAYSSRLGISVAISVTLFWGILSTLDARNINNKNAGNVLLLFIVAVVITALIIYMSIKILGKQPKGSTLNKGSVARSRNKKNTWLT